MYLLYAVIYHELLFIGAVLVLSYFTFKYRLYEVVLGFLHSFFSGVIEIRRMFYRGHYRDGQVSYIDRLRVNELSERLGDDVEALNVHLTFESGKVNYKVLDELDSDEARVLLELVNSDGLSKKVLSARIPEFSYKRVRKIVNNLYKKSLVLIEERRVRHSKGSYPTHIVKPVDWLKDDKVVSILSKKAKLS